MKRMRQIRDHWTKEDVQFLAQLGIKVKEAFDYFNIEENESYYKIRERFAERWEGSMLKDTFYYGYSKEEFETAAYYVLTGCWTSGYPQPEDHFRYKEVSFDANKICPQCGCNLIQTNDLRIKKISKHGFWGFTAWLHDEMFVSKKIYEDVFAPLGIEKRTVIKGGKILEDVYQLVIPTIDENLNLSERDKEICPVCGEIKYTPQHYKYPFFPLHEHPLPGIYKTKEWFGSGHAGWRMIIISKEVVEKLIQSKDLKRVWLIPCRRA